jgi:hypothetical protein
VFFLCTAEPMPEPVMATQQRQALRDREIAEGRDDNGAG